MLKKHTRLIKFGSFLLALAPMVATRQSGFWFIGEPKMPKKLKETK